jgi:hypothetical protein
VLPWFFIFVCWCHLSVARRPETSMVLFFLFRSLSALFLPRLRVSPRFSLPISLLSLVFFGLGLLRQERVLPLSAAIFSFCCLPLARPDSHLRALTDFLGPSSGVHFSWLIHFALIFSCSSSSLIRGLHFSVLPVCCRFAPDVVPHSVFLHSNFLFLAADPASQRVA